MAGCGVDERSGSRTGGRIGTEFSRVHFLAGTSGTGLPSAPAGNAANRGAMV